MAYKMTYDRKYCNFVVPIQYVLDYKQHRHSNLGEYVDKIHIAFVKVSSISTSIRGYYTNI
jgi:hypothetical protein